MNINQDVGDNDLFMVEVCERCEDWWPAGTMVEVLRLSEVAPVRICPDCMLDLRTKEKKVVESKRSNERRIAKKRAN